MTTEIAPGRSDAADGERTPPVDATGTAHAPHRVIVVLGYHETGDDGTHGISAICRSGVRRAEALAAESRPRAVIFTGWSADGGPTEADQMIEAWSGRRDVPLLREPRAVNSAENAARSLNLLRTLHGVTEVVVVCSIRHVPRVRFLFTRLYREHGYDVRYRHVWSPRPSLRLVRVELGSITRMVGDRRAARVLLDASDPTARPPEHAAAQPADSSS